MKRRLAQAKKYLQLSEYTITVTYPVVKDARVFLGVLDNLFLAAARAISCIMPYQKLTIEMTNEEFDEAWTLFKDIAKIHRISGAEFVREIHQLIVMHRDAPVEFSKNRDYIICSEDYKIRKISGSLLKDYIKKSSQLISTIQRLTV